VTGRPGETLDQARRLAGFTPATLRHDEAELLRIMVTTMVWPDASGLVDPAGQVVPLTSEELTSYSPPGETLDEIRIVDIGGTEALCLTRDYGQDQPLGHCVWRLNGPRIDLWGPDVDSVIELARLVETD